MRRHLRLRLAKPEPRGHVPRWRLVGVAVLATVFAGCSVPPAPAPLPGGSPTGSASVDPNAFGPGADGIGDTYYPQYGNGGYDVANYDLDLTYDPAAQRLSGEATITATATANLTSFNLDFTGLDISSTTVNDAPAQIRRDEAELVVTPASPLATGTSFTTVVVYEGRPGGYNDPMLGQTGFLISSEGAIALGEPEVAATWFPVNDHPRDKATYTIRIAVPSALSALSNGVLLSREDAERSGYTAWTWQVTSPMASYLATVVIGNYRVHESTHDGIPVVVAVHTSLATSVDAELARTPEIIDFLETVFGPYPFDAMGGIAINEPRLGFALEVQTRPVYAHYFFGGGDASWVIAHENAHQWFGDSVSVHDWRDIWLNEGFATYAEWLWSEHQGSATPQQIFDSLYDGGYGPWSIPTGDPGVEALFSGAVYDRGAMTLQALRVSVGDEDFFEILREWMARKKDSTGTSAELIALAEEISGDQLDDLFNDWLYGTSRPPRP